jgi:AraC family transcriptional regulator
MERKTFFSEQHISVTHSVTSAAIPLHSHAEYVFGYYFRGLSRCRVGSKSNLDFGPGDLGVLNPGSAHEDFASEQERDYLTINIKRELFQGLTLRGMKDLPYFGAPKLSNDPEICKVCELLRSEVDNEHFGRDAMVRSLVIQFAVQLLRLPSPGGLGLDREEAGEVHRIQVTRASEYLRENYLQAFNLDEVAGAAGLSKYHLERVFKRATGLNLHTYMVLIRLDRAKQILSTTLRPIAEIALELGFSDQSHFTNVFKRFLGVTPHAYRLATK